MRSPQTQIRAPRPARGKDRRAEQRGGVPQGDRCPRADRQGERGGETTKGTGPEAERVASRWAIESEGPGLESWRVAFFPLSLWFGCSFFQLKKKWGDDNEMHV